MANQMPYLHWEDKSIHKHYRNTIEGIEFKAGLREVDPALDPRRELPMLQINDISNLKKEQTILKQYLKKEQTILEQYLKKEQTILEQYPKKGHWQVRRSLDQSYYSSLEDTFERDDDQVIDRFARTSPQHRKFWGPEHTPILMVHQLWLWVVDGKIQINISSCREPNTLRRHFSNRLSSEIELPGRPETTSQSIQ